MSEEVYRRAGLPPDALPAHEVDARGRDGKVKVRAAQARGRSQAVHGRRGAGGIVKPILTIVRAQAFGERENRLFLR